MFGLGVPELIIILVIALVIFGPAKLPEVGSALGKTIREFKNSAKEVESTVKIESEEPQKNENKEKE